MPALSFSHIGITVPDLERAVAFYSEAFELYVIMPPTEIRHDDSAIGQMCDDVFGEGWGSFRIAHLSTGDGIGLELFEFPATRAEKRPFEYCSTSAFRMRTSKSG
jgi:catechol 2,3-dioxygenase-like lactoylglutathione lyase family enzyme